MIAAALAALALAAHPCSTVGTPPFTAPDSACTPGAFVRKTKADVCDGQTVRPTLPAAERRAILANYGVPTFNGTTGELDHRQPLALGGTTDRRNVWPQVEVAGFNPKDRLESYVLRRVCKGLPHPMSLRAAHAIFAGSWVAYFRFYHLEKP
jgi:hypothetical protein